MKGTDILLKQIQCSNIGKSLNIIALYGLLSVTVGHLRFRFHAEGHHSIADRRLHMLFYNLSMPDENVSLIGEAVRGIKNPPIDLLHCTSAFHYF